MADPTKKRWLTEDEIVKAGKMAGMGMTVQQIADVLGIGRATYERRLVDQDGVAEGIKKAKAQLSEKLRTNAYQMAFDGNVAMTIFLLKVREGWKESVDVNLIPKPTIIERHDGTVLELGAAKQEDEGD